MRPLLSCLALGLLACAAPTESGEEAVGTARSAIIAGADSPSAEDSVVAIAIWSNGAIIGLCSGTAVAPNLVLTARHCVSQADSTVLCTANGTAMSGAAVHADRSPADLDVYRGATAIQTIVSDAHRTNASAHSKSLVVDGSTLCNADLAFLVLDRALAGPYAPIRTTPTPVGDSLTAVGYGLTESGTIPKSRQTRGGIVVRAAGPASYFGGAGLGDAELLVGESSCNGDSGGPLLSSTGAVVAVTSRGGGGTGPSGNDAASCMGESAHSIYTHLATKPDLIARAYAAAGKKIWREGGLYPYANQDAIDPAATANLDPNDAGNSTADGNRADASNASTADASAERASDPMSTSTAAPAGTNDTKAFSCTSSPGGARTPEGLVVLCAGVAVLARRRLRRRPRAA